MSEVATKSSAHSANKTARNRSDYEDFLYNEAALLDEWRLDEWYSLFTTDAIYEVPTAGASKEADSAEELFYVADDYGRLGHRIKRLKSPGGHSEWPRSIGARLVSNVRILDIRPDEVEVGCTFVTYRSKNDITDAFFGHVRYVFREDQGTLKIASKRVFLDMNKLRPQGRVSIIL